MTLLRISAPTSAALDSLKARMARVQATLSGATTTEALQRAEGELAAISAEAKALRLMVRGEIGQASKREREDKSQRRSA